MSTSTKVTSRMCLLLQVLGLVGTNGTGKSTALKILSAKLKPNLGALGFLLCTCAIGTSDLRFRARRYVF